MANEERKYVFQVHSDDGTSEVVIKPASELTESDLHILLNYIVEGYTEAPPIVQQRFDDWYKAHKV